MRYLNLFLLSCVICFPCLAQVSSVPGGFAKVIVSDDLSTQPQVFYNNNKVLIFKEQSNWVALVGISLDQTPGQAQLDVKQGWRNKKINFEVHAKDYPQDHITIQDKSKVTPSKEHYERVTKEVKKLKRTFAKFVDKDFEQVVIKQPTQGRISGVFGVQRFINGKKKNVHKGIDIAAPTGAKVNAAQKGTITLVDALFYTGNTVVIDHGQGLQTIYCHMDKTFVHENQEVNLDEVIGTVGQTGRASGPHLHFGVNLNQQRVDPALIWVKR